MKNIVSILMVGLLLTACNKEEKKTDVYVINGTAEGVYNGVRVYLNAPDERGAQRPQDTAIVMDGKFQFEGKVDAPQMWFLGVDNVQGYVPVMVENEYIDIAFNKETIADSKVTGTKSNEALSSYSKGFNALMTERNDLNTQMRALGVSADSAARAKLTDGYAKLDKNLQDYPFNFLKTHKDNYFSLSLIENILKSNPADIQPVEDAFVSLDNDIKNSTYGQTVKSSIDLIKRKNESVAMLTIGNVAPDFTAPDPDGKQVKLSEIRGKATIIDFWASWCKPCRVENPNVVKVYNKYHDKGLEIISVSLDRPGQKDRWLQAIEDDNLTWHHVSNLQYFTDPVAQLYNIQAIPATYILDADGKIVAKSLRGQALEDKIAEMLN